MEPLTGPTTEWYRSPQEGIRQTVWAHPSIKHSYFMTADGDIRTVSPWRLSDFHADVREPCLVGPTGGMSMRSVMVEAGGAVVV